MALHVKKGDNVLVLAGKDKGKIGKVLSANPTNHTVVVDGVNVVTKHRKPRSAQQPGGIEKVNGNIACGKATRVGNAEVNGKKSRVCVKCGASLDAKAAKAEKKAAKKATKTADTAATETTAEEKPVKKTAAKKTTTKKTGEATAEKKTAAKKTAAKKTDESSDK